MGGIFRLPGDYLAPRCLALELVLGHGSTETPLILAKKYRHTFCYAAYRGLCPELDLGDASDVRVFRNDRSALEKDNRQLFRCEPGRRWNYSDSVRYRRLGSGNVVMDLGLQVALLHGSRTDRDLLFHVNGTMGACLGQMGLHAKHDCCAGPECGSLAFSAINGAGSPGDLDRRAASTTKSPFITKPRIGVTGRLLAVAVGEGRVEEGS